MDKPPIITYDFVTSQLKIIMASAIAYSLGKGWLNGADAGILASILTAAGSLAIPMIWAGASNWRTKKVPSDSVAIDPHTPADATAPVGANVAGRVVGALAILILGSLAFPGDASAQVKLGPVGTAIKQKIDGTAAASTSNALSNVLAELAKPFQDLANFIGDDVDGAVALATVIPEIQDGHGQQCSMALASFGRVIKAHPVPLTLHVATDFEALRLLGIATNRLCANVHCTQVFADISAQAQAVSPIPLPIPALHDICSKVPQIALVDPVSVPTPDAPK